MDYLQSDLTKFLTYWKGQRQDIAKVYDVPAYKKEKIIIVGFNEVLNYEVYENGSNSTFGGNAGGLFGGIFAAETNGMCKDLKLIIRLNSFENAQIVYNIISNTTFNAGLNKSTSQYKSCISSMQEVVSFLEVVKKQNRNTKPVIEDQS